MSTLLRRQFTAFLLIVTLFVTMIGVVKAAPVAPPNIVSYQGRVLNSAGVPITDASVSVIFKLYNDPTAGTCLWSNSSATCASSTARTVTLSSGLFSENLGDATYQPILSTVFSDNAAVYLGITIGADAEMTPRKRMTAAPYALNAQTLDGIDSTSFLQTTGTLAVTNGGTGSATASGARTNLGLGSVENTALSTWAGSTSITTLGTISTGTWSGSFGVVSGANLTNLTATTNANLTGPITSVGNATSVASQTGTGSTFVMQTSPEISTSLTTGSASFDLLNTTATTVNFAGAATTLNLGSTNTVRAINIGTGNLADTINIGTGGGTDVIHIGDDATAKTIAIGNAAATSVSITDNNWNVSTTGTANFVSIGATTAGTGKFSAITLSQGGDFGDTDITTSPGEALIMQAATPLASNTTGPIVAVYAGNGTGINNGGELQLQGGLSGSGITGNGGAVSIIGGGSEADNGNGGAVVITGGLNTGTGVSGQISLGASQTSAIILGNVSATALINSLNWTVTTAGLITTADDLALNGGDITTSASVFNFLDQATTKTIDIGGVDTSGIDTINIATNGTAGDTISIGNGNASTLVSLTGGDDWGISTAGVAAFKTTTVTQAAVGTVPLTITGIASGTANQFSISTQNTSGNLMNAAYPSATALTGDLIGLNLDLTTNVSNVTQNATGIQVYTPQATGLTAGQKITGINVGGETSPVNGAITSAAGFSSWTGVNVISPAITQTGGTLSAADYFAKLTPANITTGGTYYGYSVFSSGATSGVGSVYGVDVGDISDASATTTAAYLIGSGWDNAISGTTAGTNLISFTNFSVTTAGLITTANGLAVNGGDLTSTSTTFNLLNDLGATDTLSIGSNVDDINIGWGVSSNHTINVGANGTGNSNIIRIGSCESCGPAGTTTDTIEIATSDGGADTVTIGNTNASTTVAITGGDDWGITTAGVVGVKPTTGRFDTLTAGVLNLGTTTATSATIGSSALTGLTVTTDGTGDAEVNLPAESIGSSEIANGAIAAADVGTDLGFSNFATNMPLDITTNFQLIAGQQLNINEITSAPTLDMFNISNSGFVSTTDGVDGMTVTFGTSAASGDAIHILPSFTTATTGKTYNGLEVEGFTPAVTAAVGATVSGLSVGNITQSETGGGNLIAYGLNIGTGWNSSNLDDADIHFGSITPTISIPSAADMKFNAGLFQIAHLQDNASYGEFSVNGLSSAFTKMTIGSGTGSFSSNATTFGILTTGIGTLNMGHASAAVNIYSSSMGLSSSNSTGTTTTSSFRLNDTSLTTGTLLYGDMRGTSGTAVNFAYGGAVTQSSAAFTGLAIDLTNLTGANGLDMTNVALTTKGQERIEAGSETVNGLTVASNAALMQSTAAGTFRWNGISVTSPAATSNFGGSLVGETGFKSTLTAITGTLGSVFSNGFGVSIPDSAIVTTGFMSGFEISGTGSLGVITTGPAVGTLTGLRIANITTPGAGTENAIDIGSGWDTVLSGTTAGTNLISFTNFNVTTAGVITGTFATANTERLCWDADGGSDITDCTGTPGDYAEQHGSSDATIVAGDIVITDASRPAEEVTDADGRIGSKSWVLKSNQSYQSSAVGIVSTDPNEVIGQNFTPEEHPYPIALNGRVPVNVTNENGPIHVGDFVTTSSTAGKGMKATLAGRIIGMALADFDGVSGQVMIQVNNSWYFGNLLGNDGTSTLLTSDVIVAPVSNATATTQTFDSYGLALRGSAWDGNQAQTVSMMFKNTVTDGSNYRLSVRNTTDSEVAYITNTGTMQVAGDMVVGGKIYPSNLGGIQKDKYIYYDGSAGPGGDFMRTNASGWSTGSYDFAEMFPSTEDLVSGDVVVFSEKEVNVKRSSKKNEKSIAGIVSTRPGFLAGENTPGSFPIALAGRVPTNVNLENGEIGVGDPLTTSSTSGFAMKATKAGPIVGYALEPFDGSQGKITVFVSAGFWGGDTTSQTPGADNRASLFGSSGDNMMTSLSMNGNINMSGNEISNIGRMNGLADAWIIEQDGTIKTESLLKTIITGQNNQKVETIAVTSPEAVITLSGTSMIKDGQAEVNFVDVNKDFGNIISAIAPVRVVATPHGPVSLYVSEKDQNHFIVKSFGGNASDVEFDWVVTGYRKGYEPGVAPVVDTTTTTTPITSSTISDANAVGSGTPPIMESVSVVDGQATPATTADISDISTTGGQAPPYAEATGGGQDTAPTTTDVSTTVSPSITSDTSVTSVASDASVASVTSGTSPASSTSSSITIVDSSVTNADASTSTPSP